MEVGEHDPVSGHDTTGHVWNGIKELDTPIPRGILIFLVVTHVFAVLWWFLMPTWPLGSTYTKGLLGIDQHELVKEELLEAAAARADWVEAIETGSFEEIQSNEALMEIVRNAGHQLFGDNCAACHGVDATGRAGYPSLIDEDWIWGSGPDAIAETMRVGVNSMHVESRFSEMPAFGRDQILSRAEVADVAAYVYSLSHPQWSTPENLKSIRAGEEVFQITCAACHGEDGSGMPEAGAPNLTDSTWIYGGNLETIVTSVHGGRQGHMPTWDERLTPVEIKILALYVHSLSLREP